MGRVFDLEMYINNLDKGGVVLELDQSIDSLFTVVVQGIQVREFVSEFGFCFFSC